MTPPIRKGGVPVWPDADVAKLTQAPTSKVANRTHFMAHLGLRKQCTSEALLVKKMESLRRGRGRNHATDRDKRRGVERLRARRGAIELKNVGGDRQVAFDAQ